MPPLDHFLTTMNTTTNTPTTSEISVMLWFFLNESSRHVDSYKNYMPAAQLRRRLCPLPDVDPCKGGYKLHGHVQEIDPKQQFQGGRFESFDDGSTNLRTYDGTPSQQ